ncbi:MAG: methionyl-tRNA formyltransferase [Planctomycetota bacterium]|jgi:methionyl-tRNA formyltransferase
MRTVFLGSPPFATPVLNRLLASPVSPGLVVTPPPRPRGRGRTVQPSAVSELAHAAGVEVWEPDTVKDGAFLERLKAWGADCFLVVSYGELLRQEFLDLPRLRCLNVHPSLLPRWRGATPIPAAIRAGDAITGTTIQEVVLALDAGDVLVQRELPIEPGETSGELAVRLAELSGEASVEALEALASGKAEFTPQDPDRVTLCRKMQKEDGAMNWSLSAVELERHVRSFNPWPLASTLLPAEDGTEPKKFNVLRATTSEHACGAVQPGTVLEAKKVLVVATGDGALQLDEVQVQGKKALPTTAYLAGARLVVGDRFGQ